VPEPRPFLFLPLFNQPRRSGILRSPFAGSCIDRPPRGLRMASKALHAAWRWSTHLVLLDGCAPRRMLGCCRSRLSHFPRTYAQGTGSSQSNPAPPRPDPLRVWEGSLLPSGTMASANICVRQGSIRNGAYLSIGVRSSSGAGPNGALGGGISGVSGRGYAGSWI
jgi:hypothetical protein